MMGKDERRALPMNLTLTRRTGNDGTQGYVNLRFEDAGSHIVFADGEMSLESFARALLGEGCIPCIVRVNPNAPIGKTRQVKEEWVEVPERTFMAQKDLEAAQLAVKPFETDGWQAPRPIEMFQRERRRSAMNENVARVIFHRWVETPDD